MSNPDNKLSSLENIHWSLRYGICVAFLLGIFLYVLYFVGASNYLLIFAALAGGYMAINIGANDVANNVGPAVGSGAISLVAAVGLAAVCEGAGALLAGGDVVSTIKKGIIDPSGIADTRDYIWLMAGALIAGAVWLNFATWMGAPVSTTHSIVGGVLGAGIAAGGLGIVDWAVMSKIVASWVISPALGGFFAAGTLALIKHFIMYREDKVKSATTYVPILVAVMSLAFGMYIVLKGFKKLLKEYEILTKVVDGEIVGRGATIIEAGLVGLVIAIIVFVICKIAIKKQSLTMENTRLSVNNLFTIPLIFAAGLLSFAHGANDVANAVGPLAAIVDAYQSAEINSTAGIPLWVMLIGALGLAVGLAMFGPKLIRTVGSEITELDKSRAFCIVLAAAVTVIIASQLGLPVSSTHIALGGIFGVGFLREFLKTEYATQLHELIETREGAEREELQNYLNDFHNAPIEEMREMVKKKSVNQLTTKIIKSERKQLKKAYKQELVKRQHLYKIIAAWIITVPVSGVLAAMVYFILRGISM
ncbi:MAG: inorganic phosphate transporter [Saccharospirillaceae bacterium]|nr:inorganic phosphate transporter [Pseudomonadales bacterium]NRB77569.1 inorganic phosphate transporter [Saccharospirillaceae bacterium]